MRDVIKVARRNLSHMGPFCVFVRELHKLQLFWHSTCKARVDCTKILFKERLAWRQAVTSEMSQPLRGRQSLFRESGQNRMRHMHTMARYSLDV